MKSTVVTVYVCERSVTKERVLGSYEVMTVPGLRILYLYL